VGSNPTLSARDQCQGTPPPDQADTCAFVFGWKGLMAGVGLLGNKTSG
jgi:hypothetical protein